MPKIPIPADVMDRAYQAAYPGGYEQHTADIDSAAGVIVAWLDETFRLSDPRHLVRADPDGWTVQHPQSCRPNLFTCPWSNPAGTTYAQFMNRMEPEPAPVGYVYVGGQIPDPEGPGGVRLVLGDRVGEDGQPDGY